MRINFLYLLMVAAAIACYQIVLRLRSQGDHTFFGSAETESCPVNVDFPALVQRVWVRPGLQVRRGDTLAVLFRAELNQKSQEYLLEMERLDAEQTTKVKLLAKERDLALAQQSAQLSKWEEEIRLLEAEMALQNDLKAVVGAPAQPANASSNLKAKQIEALRKAMEQAKGQYVEQLAQIAAQQKGSEELHRLKTAQIRQSMGFVDAEKPRLVLLSPIDGYVEQVSLAAREMVQPYRELFRIFPHTPNKVIGFLHESATIPFRIGDTVQLASASRPNIFCRAILTGSSPKMVELPFRLRKFSELRTWGRELYIQLPSENPFFIGEKIVAKL